MIEYYYRASAIVLNKERTEQADVAASDMYTLFL